MRDGTASLEAKLLYKHDSEPLAEIVRDINKFSNNVMAQQLFLTLSLRQAGAGTLNGSRAALRQWWRDRLGDGEAPVFGNGSGLSRDERITAQQLGRLLQLAWASPFMPELMSSLPIGGGQTTADDHESLPRAGIAAARIRLPHTRRAPSAPCSATPRPTAIQQIASSSLLGSRSRTTSAQRGIPRSISATAR